MAALAGVGLSTRSASASGIALTGGNNLLYIGTYAGNVQIFDEATEQMIGEIKLQDRHPALADPVAQPAALLRARLDAREDRGRRHRLARVARHFTLSSGSKQTRIRSMQVDPLERFLILLSRSRDQDRRSLGDQRRRAAALRPAREARSRATSRGRAAKSARTSTSGSRPTASCCTSSATTS